MEASILAPTNPYSASKAAAEMLIQAYYKSFNLPLIITRSNNVYGPCVCLFPSLLIASSVLTTIIISNIPRKLFPSLFLY